MSQVPFLTCFLFFYLFFSARKFKVTYVLAFILMDSTGIERRRAY